ncbi:MAG: hypothetical protein IKX59_01495 [Bacteroidales bacterium]|nr:hypothetical protein [Bacteroidales bacterium]
MDKVTDSTKLPRKAPIPNKGNTKSPHRGKQHNGSIDLDVNSLRNDPTNTDIRKNQVQVDSNGNVVGNNRPDLQWNDADGVHHIKEYDTKKAQSEHHKKVITKNDPNANCDYIIIQ